jgi:predicted chitinase/peptidoglycan hydrolase-like protein with peptidoglycan-binding domain
VALTPEVLERLGVPDDDARRYVPLLGIAMREFGITTPVRARMFLAQLAHESAGLTAFEERASGADYEGNRALGNTRRGDGVRFKGRGPIQLTGRWNYTHYGRLLGVDLVKRPQLAAQPRYGFRLAAAYFEDRGCNAAADRGDFRECTRLINAALLHYDRRLELYEKLAKVDPVPGAGYLERGDHGDGVRTLTRRLSFVRAKATGKPYLDGKRMRFDAETETALRAFQQEHGLTVDGKFGPRSARKLAKATERDKARRTRTAGVGAPAGTGVPAGAPTGVTRLPDLVRRLDRLEAAADRTWDEIVAHGRRRAVALPARVAQRRATAAAAAATGELNAILRRIEAKLGTLVEIEQREAEAGNGAPVATATKVAAAASPNSGAPAAKPPATDADLLERVDELDRALHRTRRRVISRYAAVDKVLPPPPAPRRREPRRKPTPQQPPDEAGVRALQEELNRFTQRHLHNVGPLIVDGVKGPATRARIRRAKYWLGYSARKRRTTAAGPELVEHLRHPRKVNPAMLARGVKRRRAQRRLARKSSVDRAGVVQFDGHAVAGWIEPHLQWARANGWKGTIYSGYRTPEHSEEICRQKCGAPTCPGRCAGRTSNHSGRVAPAGAVDVSDYVTFGRLMARSPHRPRLMNALPTSDPNHFSASGR